MTKIVGFIAIIILLLVIPEAANAEQFRLPVDASITDSFRPPTTPYGPGNRGWEFATIPGEDVHASADGIVVFAGQVGGVLNVVIQHDNDLLTTYSKLDSISVARNQKVMAGQQIGIAGSDTYFGARLNGSYIDPATLFGDLPYLVSANSSTAPAPRSETTSTAGAQLTRAEFDWLSSAGSPNGVPSYWPVLGDNLSRLHL